MYSRWLLAAAFLAACGGGGEGTGNPDGGTTQSGELPKVDKTDWAIFVYGHGDHNLSPSLVQDMIEMSKAHLQGRVNVIVVADWNGSLDGFKTGTEWYRMDGDGAQPRLVATGPELNFDDPGVLTATIAAAFKATPADHHGVIIWDHGGARKLGFGSDTQDGTVAHPTGIAVRTG